tara:strand:- start:66 stop:998 length:933 start_codon:yes stop_codon:yes gene_type:complete
MNKYKVSGLVIETEIDLPLLIKSTKKNADFIVKLGNISEEVESSFINGKAFKICVYGCVYYVNDKNETFMTLDTISTGFVKCLIDCKNEVTLDCSNSFIKVCSGFILNSVLTMISINNNLFPIHAYGLNYNGGAFLIVAPAGSGKSVLNVSLQQRGIPMISDDFVNIYMKREKPYVFSGYPAISLKDDAINILNMWDLKKIALKDTRKTTFHSDLFKEGTIPLKKIYVLSEGDDMSISDGLDIKNKISILNEHSYIPQISTSEKYINYKKVKKMISDLSSTVKIVEFKRPIGIDRLDDSVDFILDDIKNT